MNIPFPANPSDGDAWTAAKIAADKAAITAYTVPVTDLANQYAPFVVTLCTDSLASGATHTYRLVTPASQTWVPVSATVSYQSTGGSSTVTLQFTDDGTNVLTSAASAASAGGTPTAVTAFDVTSIAAGSLLVFTLSCSGGSTATNVTGVVHFKCKHIA